jgi:hypothetical protein
MSMIPPGYDPGNPAANAAQGSTPPGSDAQAGGQATPAPDQGSPDANVPNPAASTPASPQGQALNGATQGGARAKGTQQDANDAATAADPNAPVPATPAEQAQYHQLVTRFLLFISDKRKATPKHPSPWQSVLAMLNNPHVPLAVAIGSATAHIVFTMVHAAQAQKITYDPEVLFHATDELVTAMYLLGNSQGLFNGMPPFQGLQKDGNYNFSDAELRVLGESKMQAVRAFGTLEVKAGMITPDVSQANQAFWKQQIQREVESGNVSDGVLQSLSKQGVFDKIHQALGTTSGSVNDQLGKKPLPGGADAATPPPQAQQSDASVGGPPDPSQPPPQPPQPATQPGAMS